MAKAGLATQSSLHLWGRVSTAGPPVDSLAARTTELEGQLLSIIVSRGILVALGISAAQPLGILPAALGPFPFAPAVTVLLAALTVGYLGLWWSHWRIPLQFWIHFSSDLILTTALVAFTHGIQSPFVSFYLLIITYSSLAFGRNGGMIGAAFSAILYSGLITCIHLQVLSPDTPPMETRAVTFRISLHALGFFAVARLGTTLSGRLRAVQEELQRKIESLRRLQTLNERIVTSIRSGLITTDLNGRIAVSNAAAEEIMGRTGNEMLDMPVQQMIGREFWNQVQAAELLSHTRALRYESWVEIPRDGKRFLGFSVSPMQDEANLLIGFIISFQDLTEIKRLEEEIRRKERMATIGKMAAGIAHEIRNPLTSMRGSVEVLRSRGHFLGSDARLLDILVRESDRLNNFVEGFLVFAKPARQTHESVELVSLLQDTTTLLRNSHEVRGKHLVRLDTTHPEVRILGNAYQIQQVFWNLAQNALRAMPAGGTLSIAAGYTAPESVQITFRDTGIGLSDEQQQSLFQPLESGFREGMGLGLSITLHIVEDHGGRMTFRSDEGKGTEVTISLPAEPGRYPTADQKRGSNDVFSSAGR